MKRLLMVPCYNADHTLPYFFATVRLMNPKPDHIIFTYNNCTDNTAQLLEFANKETRVPCEVHQLYFDKDAIKKGGSYSVMGTICQFMWERARAYKPDFAYLTAVDTFADSPDILRILSDWDVPFVTPRVVRSFPEGICLAAKWQGNSPDKFRMIKSRAQVRWLTPDKLCVGRPIASGVPVNVDGELKYVAIDDTALMASGFNCYRKDLLMDKRVNWLPIPSGCSEDFGYNQTMRKYGYKVHIDGLAVVDHVLYDEKHEHKAWNIEVEQGKEEFVFQ